MFVWRLVINHPITQQAREQQGVLFKMNPAQVLEAGPNKSLL